MNNLQIVDRLVCGRIIYNLRRGLIPLFAWYIYPFMCSLNDNSGYRVTPRSF